MREQRWVIAAAVVVALAALVGCSSTGAKADRRGPRAFDFAATAPADVAATMPSDSPGASGNSYVVDGMIGQVNGQPLYAKRIFDNPQVDHGLTQQSKELPADMFRTWAKGYIQTQVEGIIEEMLLLADAERDLNEQERSIVDSRVREKREELVRTWGSGSQILADAELRNRRDGRGLEETLNEFRQQLIIWRIIHQKVEIKVNITRKDIERYYYVTHPEQFNPKPGRTIRLIKADEEDADAIDRLLNAGTPFAKVAAQPFNKYLPSAGGLYPSVLEGKLREDLGPVNEAMLQLKEGQHSPRIRIDTDCWWVEVEHISSGRALPLHEAQQEIETLLRSQAASREERAYRERLREEGSYSAAGQTITAAGHMDLAVTAMTSTLVDIAMTRYTRPQTP